MEDLNSLVHQQTEVFEGLRSQPSTQSSEEVATTTKQLEAYQALQALFGDLPNSTGNGLISADFALRLVRLVQEESYDLIIEFGSSASTFFILRALGLGGSDTADSSHGTLRLLSFEHSESHHRCIADLVSSCGNRNQLNLQLCPLSAWSDSTGEYSYYTCTQPIIDVLKAINGASSDLDIPRTSKLLVLINNLHESTGGRSHYPAAPMVLNASSGMNVAIDFLIDDILNKEADELVLQWEAVFLSSGLDYRRHQPVPGNAGLLLRLNSNIGTDAAQKFCDSIAMEKHDREAITDEALRVGQLFEELANAEQHAQQELQHAQQASDELAERVKTLEAGLAAWKVECDTVVAEKDTAHSGAAVLQQQLDHHTFALQQALLTRDQQASQIESLTANLESTRAERDSLAIQNVEAAKATATLQQQLDHHTHALQQALLARDEQAALVKAMDAKLVAMLAERDSLAMAKEAAERCAAELQHKLSAQMEALQRLRHLARPLTATQQ